MVSRKEDTVRVEGEADEDDEMRKTARVESQCIYFGIAASRTPTHGSSSEDNDIGCAWGQGVPKAGGGTMSRESGVHPRSRFRREVSMRTACCG